MNKIILYDPQSVMDWLIRFSHWQRIAFCAGVAARLLPNYRAFCDEQNWGHPDLMHEALQVSWAYAVEVEPTADAVLLLLDRCVASVPDSEDFTSNNISAAIDAGNAVCETLRYCIYGEIEHAVNVSAFGYDTAHVRAQMNILVPYDHPAFRQQVLEHELVQRELQCQRSELERIEGSARVDRELIAWLSRSERC